MSKKIQGVSVSESWERPKFGKKADRKKKTKSLLDQARKDSH